jgi:uncharacterized OsmC-like protein
MNTQHIRQSLDQLARHFAEHPEDALSQDKPAVAILESGLRCRTEHPDGGSISSDMSVQLGGTGSAPSPGWLLRAALANCDATVIAMQAARLGIELTRLEVTVGSESDDRGILGASGSAPAGPLSIRVVVDITAPGASESQLRELVHWAEAHSPVNDAVRRAVPITSEVRVSISARDKG